MATIKPTTLDFLKQLARNNNKEWFDAHKSEYLSAKDNMDHFMQALKERLDKTDVIEKYHLYRIYRDVRFSKDKTPYKTYMHAYLKREGANRRGGYWVGVQPGNTQIGGGFYGPEKDDLQRIRKEIEADGNRMKQIITSPTFKKLFGQLQGEGLKTAPKGFDKDHPHIDLIRQKQFYAMRPFTNTQVLSESFLDDVVETLEGVRPFFDYMTEVLTTNLNGESIL